MTLPPDHIRPKGARGVQIGDIKPVKKKSRKCG